MIKNADKTVRKTGRPYRDEMNKDSLIDNIKKIKENSWAISWEYILAYMYGHVCDEKLEYLNAY